MDKQRLYSLSQPRKKPIANEGTGNALVDGYTAREQNSLDDHKSRYKKGNATPKGMSPYRSDHGPMSDWYFD